MRLSWAVTIHNDKKIRKKPKKIGQPQSQESRPVSNQELPIQKRKKDTKTKAIVAKRKAQKDFNTIGNYM